MVVLLVAIAVGTAITCFFLTTLNVRRRSVFLQLWFSSDLFTALPGVDDSAPRNFIVPDLPARAHRCDSYGVETVVLNERSDQLRQE